MEQCKVMTLTKKSLASTALILGIALTLFSVPGGAASDLAQPTLDDMGFEATRSASYDLCFPANAEEYEALGKNAILRIEAASALSTELPLKSAYFEIKGLTIPLHRIYLMDKYQDGLPTTRRETKYWRQVTFYLVPISMLKTEPRLVVDFKGPRSGFGIGSISVDGNAPAFVRLDEYDTASEADPEAIRRLLVREYPDDFPIGKTQS